MHPRFKDICELLQQGTDNGTLRWTPFKASDAFSATVKNATFVIGIECYPDGEPIAWTLQILNASGGEVDSAQEDAQDQSTTQLSALWASVNAQHEQSLVARLQPITAALRESVLGSK